MRLLALGLGLLLVTGCSGDELVAGPDGPPVITEVTPNGTVGLQGQRITFSARATNNASAWQWNFGGGGTPNASADSAPSLTLGPPGNYSGTVTASNFRGASIPVVFTYTVSVPLP